MTNLYPYLEEIEGIEALAFAEAESNKTKQKLSSQAIYEKIYKEIFKIRNSTEKSLELELVPNYCYNLWRDEKNPKGVFRRTCIEKMKSGNPKWEAVIDVDSLSLKEGKNWVWGGIVSLKPESHRCLVLLSDGGKDAIECREFDLEKKQWVKDGFFIPESKSAVAWVNKDEILVATEWDSESLTTSGYARQIKKMKRGESLKQAELVFEVDSENMMAHVVTTPSQEDPVFLNFTSFYETEVFFQNNKSPLPSSAKFECIYKDCLIFILREKLYSIPAGSVVSISLLDFSLHSLKVVLIPESQKISVEAVVAAKDYLVIELIDNIKNKIVVSQFKGNEWKTETLSESSGIVSVKNTDENLNLIIISKEDFLNPTTLHFLDLETKEEVLIKSQPGVFESEDLVSSQKWTKSKDGTMIPYFIIHKKNIELNSSNPCLMYGYGGFEISLSPSYLASAGKAWLEKGGVYVLANIRGGGEFGSQWHQAAILSNRHKAFEDFISIAEDLISSKITSPKHLGIQGGSNGGLLVATVTTLRPDLFSAVVCEVPLIDMLNYHTLLAGSSWMAEYGNPEIAEERKYLETYSPLQQVKPGVKYPKMLIMTSTKDDRVHPAHARKMAKRLMDVDQEVFYFENTDGGHGGAASISERIEWEALVYTYLWSQLGK